MRQLIEQDRDDSGSGPLRPTAEDHSLLRLTAAEQRVLSLAAEGYSNAGIAELLYVSVRTVETHMAHIFMKLGLHDQPGIHRRVAAAVAYLQDRPPAKAVLRSSRTAATGAAPALIL